MAVNFDKDYFPSAGSGQAGHPSTGSPSAGSGQAGQGGQGVIDRNGVDALLREVGELRRLVSLQRNEIEQMRGLLENYRQDVDRSVLYLAQTINDRWNRSLQSYAELRTRIDRYLNIAPFRLLRGLRRKIKRIP